KPVTTHWSTVRRLRRDFPGLEVREGERWVDAGPVITSAGVSAGIDMSLYILERLYGSETARATARGIEYDHWQGAPMRIGGSTHLPIARATTPKRGTTQS
ncbi:MAG: hypothetical protein ACE5H9_13645, partial [Anaerolineae bacterium]